MTEQAFSSPVTPSLLQLCETSAEMTFGLFGVSVAVCTEMKQSC